MGLFEHKEIDYQKTKRNVLKVIRKYERCLTRLEANSQPKLTPTYKMSVGSSGSNGINSKVENTVTYKLDEYQSDYDFVMRILNVINSMKLDYRIIIIESFFEDLPNFDVAEKIGLGLSQLSHKKKIAIELFAYGMGCEVWLPPEEEKLA